MLLYFIHNKRRFTTGCVDQTQPRSLRSFWRRASTLNVSFSIFPGWEINFTTSNCEKFEPRSHFISGSSIIVWVNVVWNTINRRDTTHFDFEDDYYTGCRNFSHCQQQSTIILSQFITSADQNKQINKQTNKQFKVFVYLSREILRTRIHVIPCQLGRQVLWENEDCRKKRKNSKDIITE